MISTEIDPRKLSIKDKELLGMWPPSSDSIGVAIAPYIRRMRGDVDVLDIGVGPGETIAYLHEHTQNVKTFYGLSHNADYEDAIEVNLNGLDRVSRKYDGQQTAVVIVNMNESITPELLALYYEKVKPTGYFVGDLHTEPYVKEVLNKFRRTAKIGNPVQIIHKNVWFWVK